MKKKKQEKYFKMSKKEKNMEIYLNSYFSKFNILKCIQNIYNKNKFFIKIITANYSVILYYFV